MSLVAVAFDDEEQGLNGSRYYVDHPVYPLEKAQAAIIFDTMGRQFMDLSAWTMFVLGAEYSKELAAVVQKRAAAEMLVVGTDLIGPRSDFAGFAVKHIPYLFFTHATHKDYHGQGDTADRVNYQKLAQDTQFIAQIVEDIGRLSSSPKFLDKPVYPAGENADAATRTRSGREGAERLAAGLSSDVCGFSGSPEIGRYPRIAPYRDNGAARARNAEAFRFHGELLSRSLLRARKSPRYRCRCL